MLLISLWSVYPVTVSDVCFKQNICNVAKFWQTMFWPLDYFSRMTHSHQLWAGYGLRYVMDEEVFGAFIKWVWLALPLSLKHRVQSPTQGKGSLLHWLYFKINKTFHARKLLSLAVRADHYCHGLKQVSSPIKQLLCGHLLNTWIWCMWWHLKMFCGFSYPEGHTGGTSSSSKVLLVIFKTQHPGDSIKEPQCKHKFKPP